MEVTEFNSDFLNNLFKKINQKQKKVFLLRDFNIIKIHYDEQKPTNELLDSFASNSYLPYIIQPIRHTSHSGTLIDNIFSSAISKEIVFASITGIIFDNLPQFLISPNTFTNPPSNKSKVFERDGSMFHRQNFILNHFDIDSFNLLNLDEKNTNLAANSFLKAMNSLINMFHLKKLASISLNLKQNLGFFLVFKSQYLLKQTIKEIKRIHK